MQPERASRATVAGGIRPRRNGRPRIVWVLLGALFLTVAASAGMAPVRAEIPGPKYEIGEVRFENDGDWLTLSIPTEATWAHWTLANPPRIIIDLGDAISRLPNAPGLYETEMHRGPLRVFRTSQFSNTPLDRRVRITLELSAITPYEARRVGEEIRILVESPGTTAPAARLTAEGMAVGGERTPAAPRSEDRAESGPPPVAPAPASAAPIRGDGPGATPQTDRDDSTADPSPLRADLGHDAAPAISDPIPLQAPPPSSQGDLAAATSPGDPDPIAEDPYAKDLAPEPKIDDEDIAKMKSTLEELLGKENVDRITETSRGEVLSTEELDDRIGREEFTEEEWEDWKDFDGAVELESPDSLRTRRAAELLRGAVEDWLAGDLAGAEKRADRCYRYYGEYPGGMQSALLLRETYGMTGRDVLAAAIRGVPELPDTSFLGSHFFLRLLAAYFDAGDDERLLDRMQYWGPLYPQGGWYTHYHYLLGREAYIARDVELAEEHLGRLSVYDRGGDAAYLMRARLADEAGRVADALVLYRELAFAGSGPYALRALVRTADLEFQQGRIETAREVYEKLLEEELPNDERAWASYQVANCALVAGQFGTARKMYEKLAAELPDAYWSRAARDRLQSVEWEGDVARRLEEMKNP